jgi:hypothetical protein
MNDDVTIHHPTLSSHLHIFDAAILGKVCEIVVLILQVRHVDERRIEKILAQDVVLDVVYVVLLVEHTATEIIDAIHCRHADVLDAPNQVFESNQVSTESG